MTGSNKNEVSATGFAPHIEELHEFFRSRGVVFGKPDDLNPFVERLAKDESFRDEMASMVRAIIYRERDGLTPTELIELLVTAVTGVPARDEPEEVRDAVRQVTGFAAGVFRSRWNPGGSAATEDKVDTDVDIAAAKASEVATDSAARPMTPIFYQAQVVANGGEGPEVKGPEVAKEQETVLPLRGASESAGAPVLSLAGYAVQPDPVAAFLRDKGTSTAPARRSGGWGWVAAILAVVVAFGAGMYTRQWMFTRYGAAWPWHLRATPRVPAVASPGPSPSPVQPANGGAASGPAAGQVSGRRPVQVEAARSEWNGGRELATDLRAPSSNAIPAAPAGAARGGQGGASPVAGSSGAATPQPIASAAKPSPEIRDSIPRSARVTAMVGASPALMQSHLLYAPEPEYPNLARVAHIQGPVVVEALVGRDGTVVRAHAISGHRLLRAAAEEAVYERRYRPYVVNDIPMAVRTLITVDFRLR